jgi:hypothetical protein
MHLAISSQGIVRPRASAVFRRKKVAEVVLVLVPEEINELVHGASA